MKKFIVATLASTMFFPTPIFAAEEMMNEEAMVENFDEETGALSLEKSAPVEMSETTATNAQVSFVYTDENGKKNTIGPSRTIRTGTDGNTKDDLIANIPSGYHFLQHPKDITISGNTAEVQVAPHTPPTTTTTTSTYYVRYRTEKNGAIQALSFTSVDNNTITKAKIDEKLASLHIPYTSPTGLNTTYFEEVFYDSNGSLIFLGKRSSGEPLDLVRVSDDTLTDMVINLKFNGNGSAKVSLADLTIKDGKVTLTSSDLAKALNNQVQRDPNLKDVITYKVESFPTTTFEAYGLKENGTVNLNISDKDLEKAKVYAVLADTTPVELMVSQANGLSNLMTLNNLTLKDLGVSSVKDFPYGTINDKTAKVRNYIETNFNKLNYGSCDFSNDTVFAVNLITNIHPSWNKNTTLQGTVSVTLKKSPELLYEEEYTLVFENSSKPGEIVDRDTRKWKAFFKQNVGTELTPGTWTADVLPKGWKISAIQQAGSTEKKKKEVAEVSEAASINKDGNNLKLSIFSSKEIKVYVYGGKMPSNGGGGSSSEEPEEPTTPDTPMTPEDPAAPSIPSKGSAVMYRLFNPTTNEHLYTQDPAERDNLLNSGEWNNEGHGWTAPAVSSFPVYRVFNPNSGEHHYTKDKNEYDTLVSLGWTGEGKAFFSADDLDSKVTLFRLYNPSAPEAAQHHYTVYESERDDLIKDGWKFEGTAWYGLPMN